MGESETVELLCACQRVSQAAERAAIVKWLKDEARAQRSGDKLAALFHAALNIERLVHLNTTAGE